MITLFPNIKVCGITQTENMLRIATLRPAYMGFIFYPPSPRDVSEKINDIDLEELPENIKKVAVMVNMPLEEALQIISSYRFDMVQLHGNETPEYCTAIQATVPVIKAFSIKDSLPENIDKYYDSCNYFLFDTKADKPGGTGESFNHQVLKDYNGPLPFFLSGGIGPEYFSTENPFTHPRMHALDVNSRFELSPGIKDVDKVRDFMRGIKIK